MEGASANSPAEKRANSLERIKPMSPHPRPLSATRFARGGGERSVADREYLGHNNPPPPTLTEVVTTLRTLGKTELPKQLARWLDELDETGRWALLKPSPGDPDRDFGAAGEDGGGRIRQ